MSKPLSWLSLIGINENGLEGLNNETRAAIASAALVVGGKRHLALASDMIKGEAMEWKSPLEDTIPHLLARRPNPVCVLVSGDPFTYGAGTRLVRHIPLEEIHVWPAPSIFTLAASRLGWALQHTLTIGLNGRPLERIIPYLQPGARIIALSGDETTPRQLATLLTNQGFGECRMMILEHVGGPRERIRETQAAQFAFDDVARLNCIAIEVPDNVATKTRALPLTPGMMDTLFEHDGQLTKREIRAITLSSLAPRQGELLWDIGLGAGSIAIEWMLRHLANRAIGIEKHAERAARAMGNAAALGVPDLKIIVGEAPAALANVEAPDAIFIGGGASVPGTIETAWQALKPAGRLVINAVSLETEARLLQAQQQYGGSLARIGIERAERVGSMTGWRPAMTVMQWSVTKC